MVGRDGLFDDGVLSVFSDDETAVGSVFTHLKVGKDRQSGPSVL